MDSNSSRSASPVNNSDITPNDMINETSLSPSGFAACLETVNHTSYNPIINLDNPGGSAPNDATATMNVILLA